MRNHTTLWQISIIAATLAILTGRASAQAPGDAKIAARVNDEVITQAEFQAVLDSRPSPVPVSKELQQEMRKAAIEMLTDDLLVRQFLRKTVAPAEEKQKAKAKLATIRQEIVAGKIAFEDAARKYSDCPSKEKGGDIGNFPYKFVVVEPFARAAFSAKKGELTDIVATDFGFHLIKVTDRSAGEPSLFEEIRDVIRDVMAQEQELHQRILADQKKTAKIEVMVQ